MAQKIQETECPSCGAKFSAVPVRSPAGFGNSTCPGCHSGVTLPLYRAYRIAYRVICCVSGFNALVIVLAVAILPSSFGNWASWDRLAVLAGFLLSVFLLLFSVYALVKDHRLRRAAV